jgi:hypothetical protein
MVLRSVWGAAADDVWAVGDGGLAAHYGTAWSKVDVGTANGLNAVMGRSAGSVWAAGDGGTTHSLYGLWVAP